MRRLLGITTICVAVALAAAPAALARKAATGTTKEAVLQALDGPGRAEALPACNNAWTTSFPGVGVWAFVITVRETGACSEEQGGDAEYLHFKNGRWRSVEGLSDPSCRDGGRDPLVPLEVQADLLNCPR